MSDDKLLEDIDGDIELAGDDLDAVMEGAGEGAEEAGSEPDFDDDPFDDEDESSDDDPAAALDAAGDDDDEMPGEPIVDLAAIDGLEPDVTDVESVDVADDDDRVRPDEFVCRSCHMARRGSALADEDAMLCRDCV